MFTRFLVYSEAFEGATMAPKDRTGQRFGKLTALSIAGRNELKKVLWRCQCDCGKQTVVVSGDLVSGNTTSCGCVLKAAITKHGGWNTRSYSSWHSMMRRCTNPQDKDYHKYGAVGVRICERWTDYKNFVEDMGEPPPRHTLDRYPDPYGNYEPENCRWATATEQARNIRVPKRNKSGHIGVGLCGDKFLPRITAERKVYYGKLCETLEEAIQIRAELEQKYWK